MVEARDRVGGRTFSRDGWVDLGATWFWDGEAATRDLLAELGIGTFAQAIDGDALFAQAGGVMRLEGNPIVGPAHRFRGGAQALAHALARRLPPEAVRTGTAVRSIAFSSDGEAHVETTDETIAGAAVAVAVPPAVAAASLAFAPALDPSLMHALAGARTWMGDAVKAVARFEQPFWRAAGLAGTAISHVGPFREIHDHSGADAGEFALFGFAASEQFAGLAPERIAERFGQQLTELFGADAAAPTAIEAVDWRRDPFTAPERWADHAGTHYHGLPVLWEPHLDGRLVFCATETAQAYAGHLEGAILAGHRAAAQLLTTLGR